MGSFSMRFIRKSFSGLFSSPNMAIDSAPIAKLALVAYNCGCWFDQRQVGSTEEEKKKKKQQRRTEHVSDGSRRRGACVMPKAHSGVTFVLTAFLAVVAVVVVLVPPTQVSGYKFEDNLLALSESDFDFAIRDFHKILVLFHAPWCGICRGFMKDYKKAAALLKGEDSDIVLAVVNGHAEKGLMRRFKLPGFPVVKFFRSGVGMKYTGGRGARNIVSWLKSQ